MKLLHLLLALPLAPAASADIFWTGAVSGDIFDEANWDLSQSQVTVIDPNVSIDDNVVIRDAPADVILTETGGGQLRFQLEAQLKEMRATLAHLVDACAGDHRPACPILADLATKHRDEEQLKNTAL